MNRSTFWNAEANQTVHSGDRFNFQKMSKHDIWCVRLRRFHFISVCLGSSFQLHSHIQTTRYVRAALSRKLYCLSPNTHCVHMWIEQDILYMLCCFDSSTKSRFVLLVMTETCCHKPFHILNAQMGTDAMWAVTTVNHE